LLGEGQSYTITVTTGVTDAVGNPMASQFIATFTTAGPPPGPNIAGPPLFSGNSNTPPNEQIHIHITFAQSGSTLSLAPGCPKGVCIFAPINSDGAAIVGDLTPGQVWATIASLSGTINGTQISWNVTLDNGRTFSFTGTLDGTKSYTGTLTGPTQPPVFLKMERAATP
jgi:hypothetical protein